MRYTDAAGHEHAACIVCGVDCSTHPDAGNSLDQCGDCGGVTCPDHREENNAARCPKCAARFRAPALRQLRYDRTRASNRARATRDWMLTEDAPHVDPDGLPSWWPFWSDCLKSNVRDAVRAARALAAAEGLDL